MRFGIVRIAGMGVMALLCCGLASRAQTEEPRFEVVSIRPLPPNPPMILRSVDFTPILPGGRFVDSNINLMAMIMIAYEIRSTPKHLEGLPKWAREKEYAVAAQPGEEFPVLPPAENARAVRSMLRALLAERFRLKIHKETRRERIFTLETERGGLKIAAVEAPVPPAKAGLVGAAMSDRGGRIVGRKSTMQGLAVALSLFFEHPVQDRTGLSGHYDLDIRWSSPDAEAVTGAHGLGSAGLGLLISNLRSQLGLQVKSGQGPVEYWVVDQIAEPEAN